MDDRLRVGFTNSSRKYSTQTLVHFDYTNLLGLTGSCGFIKIDFSNNILTILINQYSNRFINQARNCPGYVPSYGAVDEARLPEIPAQTG